MTSRILHDEGKLGRVLVVDLDAHQGNGTAAVFRGWPWAAILDLYAPPRGPMPFVRFNFVGTADGASRR